MNDQAQDGKYVVIAGTARAGLTDVYRHREKPAACRNIL